MQMDVDSVGWRIMRACGYAGGALGASAHTTRPTPATPRPAGPYRAGVGFTATGHIPASGAEPEDAGEPEPAAEPGPGVEPEPAAADPEKGEDAAAAAAARWSPAFIEADPAACAAADAWLSSPSSARSPSSVPSASKGGEAEELGQWPRTVDERMERELADSKASLANVSGRRDFARARARANPFESAGSGGFRNRAALKLAELDAACGRVFTTPAAWAGAAAEPLTFVDLCGGPGGFTEFMLAVHGWRARGCGMTLRARGAADFEPAAFSEAAPTHSFRTHYGADGTGDLTSAANVRALSADVLRETQGLGAHVVLADGGFDVAGREQLQEALSARLVMCQAAAALATLRAGGAMLLKLFDTFLPVTLSALWVLRTQFARVAVVKPRQSRPANSERYIVCVGLRAPTTARLAAERLLSCAASSPHDMAQPPAPAELVVGDAPWVAYMRDSNARFARAQLTALEMLHAELRGRGAAPAFGPDAGRRACHAAWLSHVRVDPEAGRAVARLGAGASQPGLKDAAVELMQSLAETARLLASPLLAEPTPEASVAHKRAFGVQVARDMAAPSEWRAVWTPPGGTRAFLVGSDGAAAVAVGSDGAARVCTLPCGWRLPPNAVLDSIVWMSEAAEPRAPTSALGRVQVLGAWRLPGAPYDRAAWLRRTPTERAGLLRVFLEALRAPAAAVALFGGCALPDLVDVATARAWPAGHDLWLSRVDDGQAVAGRIWRSSAVSAASADTSRPPTLDAVRRVLAIAIYTAQQRALCPRRNPV